MSKKIKEEGAGQIIPVETVVKSKVQSAPRKVYTDDAPVQFQPFKYQEGQSVIDVIAQARQHRESLADRERRTSRMAKVTGWTNFLSSLANLAGGGYTQTRYNPSPIMQQSLNQLSNVQDEKYKSDLYYQELARKVRQEDYSNQLKNHIDQEEKLASLNQARVRENNKALNAAASDEFRAGGVEISEKGISPYEVERRAQEQAARNRSANASTVSANASMVRAQASASGNKNKQFLVYTDSTGAQKTMGKSQAQQIINDVASMHPQILKKEELDLTPLEKAIKSDMDNLNRALGSGNVEATDNLIRAVALKYIKAGYTDFQHYFNVEDNEDNTSGTGLFLPKQQTTQSTAKKNLLQ